MPLDFLPNVVWESAIGFTLLVSAFVAVVGGSTGSLTIGFVAGYAAFSFISINSGITLLQDTQLATLVLIVLAVAFKLWRAEGAPTS